MRIIWTGICFLGLVWTGDAAFDHYKVTDVGIPNVGGQHIFGLTYFDSKYTNNGVGTATVILQNSIQHYLYRDGAFELHNPPQGELSPTESDWFGYGNSNTYADGAKAGYFRNGQFHDVPASGNGWNIISCAGTSQTKYIFGGEAPNSNADVQNRPYYFDVTTGVKTILPFIDGRDMVYAGLDTGVFAVGAGTHSTLPYLWKNGHYTQMGLNSWEPKALSRTEWVAGKGGSFSCFFYHNGVETAMGAPNIDEVTGISDKGVVSTYMAPDAQMNVRPAWLISVADIGAKIDDLVVNKPSNMTIYGASINYDGHMFGQAKVGNEHHFVLLDPVPEPATWVVVGVGAITLIRRKSRFLRLGDQTVTIASNRRRRPAIRGCRRTNLVACLMKCAKRRF
jgi:hypothetical protein